MRPGRRSNRGDRACGAARPRRAAALGPVRRRVVPRPQPGPAGGSHAALVHWHRYGWREERWPNPYFDPAYYRARNPDCAGDPLLHYIMDGEAAGARPVLHFDPAWYRGQLRRAGRASCAWRTSCATGTPAGSARCRSSTPRSTCARTRTWPRRAWTRSNTTSCAASARARAALPRLRPARGMGRRRLHPNPLLGLLRWREQARLDAQRAEHRAGGAAQHTPECRVRGGGAAAARPAAAGQAAGVLPAAIPPDAGERCVVGARVHRMDQPGPRAAALRRALPAAHPARPRPLHAGRRRHAAPADRAGEGGGAARLRVLLLLVQRPPPAGRAARGVAGRPGAGHAVLPDVGQRELDPALGRLRRPGAGQPGLPHRGRAGADRGVRAPFRRPALHPARRPPGADGVSRPADPGHAATVERWRRLFRAATARIRSSSWRRASATPIPAPSAWTPPWSSRRTSSPTPCR